MTIERIYFKKDNFILTLMYGKLTNAQIGEHVVAMNKEYASCTGVTELADCRFLTDVSKLTPEQLSIAASMEEGQPRTLGGKGAIVVSNNEIFALARVYAAVASNARDDSQVFRDLDAAINWLKVDQLRDEILVHSSRIENSGQTIAR